MNFEQMLELLALVAIIVLPALAITMRIALKPVVDAILRLSEGLKSSERTEISRTDSVALRQVNEELEGLRAQVRELRESEVFYKELVQPRPPGSEPVP